MMMTAAATTTTVNTPPRTAIADEHEHDVTSFESAEALWRVLA